MQGQCRIPYLAVAPEFVSIVPVIPVRSRFPPDGWTSQGPSFILQVQDVKAKHHAVVQCAPPMWPPCIQTRVHAEQ